MELLYWFESIRMPFLDTLFSYVTLFGEESLFILIAVIMMWCVDKRAGYYMLTVGFLGNVANAFLKLCFRIPRPWVHDPNFTIVESAREAATGFSFPSGHTQAAFATLGVPARITKILWLRIVLIALLVLVPISRMYLGVHYPSDVGISILVGLVLLFTLYPVFYGKGASPKRMYILFSLMALLSVAFLLFVELYSFPTDLDADNYESGVKNAYTMLGCAIALLPSYYIDQKYVHFKTEAPLWGQVLKVALGLAIALAIRMVLKQPLLNLFGGHHVADAVRYFLMMLFAGGLWPMTFKFFSGKKS